MELHDSKVSLRMREREKNGCTVVPFRAQTSLQLRRSSKDVKSTLRMRAEITAFCINVEKRKLADLAQNKAT